jgi:protein SCO1/2
LLPTKTFEERPMRASTAIRSAALALSLALVGCTGGGGGGSTAATEKGYEVRGKVMAVDPAKPAVTLDHEDIPGLMKAMKMEFVVEDAKLLQGVKVGDRVEGRLRKGESGYVLTRLAKSAGR